jgi:hypothetical protein
MFEGMADLILPAASSYAVSMSWGLVRGVSPGSGEVSMPPGLAGDSVEISGAASGAAAAGGTECRTCSERKYVDGSDDPGVSFKSPQHVSPAASAGAVMSHEREHVNREQAKAAEEGRRVVSQHVQIQSSICPECGRTYVAGGTTTTVTAPEPSSEPKGLPGRLLDRSA